jgi:acetyl esterase/lipase
MTPEYPYPTPFEDCFAAYKWLLEQGFCADKIVTAGDSCGGALATAVPLAAKQRGIPVPAAAISIAPWYDVLLSGASITENAENDVSHL